MVRKPALPRLLHCPFRKKLLHSDPKWLFMESTVNHVHAAETKCSASATRRTRRTIVHIARPVESYSRIAPCPDCYVQIGLAPWKSWKKSGASNGLASIAGGGTLLLKSQLIPTDSSAISDVGREEY